MSDKTREAFEKRFPCPEDVALHEIQGYVPKDDYNPDSWHSANLQEGKWQAWQAAHEMYAPKWKVFISSLRESDRHIESLYTLGGCYRFVKLLQTVCDGVVPMINARRDHAAAMIDGKLYDITGEINQEGFCEATIADLIEMDEWSFDKHHMLAIGECPHCEEPLPAPLPKQEQAE